MISWTRYTTKGASDPLVGRDLLYGTVFGIDPRTSATPWTRRSTGTTINPCSRR